MVYLDVRIVSIMFELEIFDCILVDVLCFGFGVFCRKLDIKYVKIEKDIYKLVEI